jgi:hypothetical protein
MQESEMRVQGHASICRLFLVFLVDFTNAPSSTLHKRRLSSFERLASLKLGILTILLKLLVSSENNQEADSIDMSGVAVLPDVVTTPARESSESLIEQAPSPFLSQRTL